MSFNSQIVIGPEFFAKSKLDYRCWKWAVAREFMQNSQDAPGTKNIEVTIENEGENTRLIVWNDGEAMTKDIVVNKLLALGGSGKGFQGTVGGFGKAKEVLYMTHLTYEILTGDILVDGSGAGYNLTEGISNDRGGTRSSVLVHGDEVNALRDAFRQFITLSQWRGRFTLDGEEITQRLNKGRGRKDLSYGKVYTNSDQSELLAVRIDGTPMFVRYVGYKGCVVLELNGKSIDVLQSNRDSLKWNYTSELDCFITDLAVNKRSALRDNTPAIERKRYSGYKLKGKSRAAQAVAITLGKMVEAGTLGQKPLNGKTVSLQGLPDGLMGGLPAGGTGEYTGGVTVEPGEDIPVMTAAFVSIQSQVRMGNGTGALAQPVTKSEVQQPMMRPDFFIKNETGLKIPAWFTPEEFSTYSKTLIWRWMSCLVAMADLFECTTPFSVGFTFSEEHDALHEKDGDDNIIYVKPVNVIRRDGKPGALECKWKFDQDGIWNLVSLAAHEFVHHLGFRQHDEDYSSKFTEIMGRILAERTKFVKIFQAKVEWPEDTN